MEELEIILRRHGANYRQMEPMDGIKLIYQNEFGCGHFVQDEQACLAFLRREYETTPRNLEQPLEEEIGNGFLRISLAALPEEKLEWLGQVFLISSRFCQGERQRFLQKLTLFQQLTEQGCFSFSMEALAVCLRAYEAAGFPAVSHSETYRQAYHPAYRVVRKENWVEKKEILHQTGGGRTTQSVR